MSRLPTIDRSRPRRALLLALIVLPMAVALGSAWRAAFRSDDPVYSCWLLPNASVSYTSIFDPSCPMEAYERVIAVRIGEEAIPIDGLADLQARTDPGEAEISVRVESRSGRRWITLPIVEDATEVRERQFEVAALLALSIALFAGIVTLRTLPAAAVPIALLSSSSGVYMISALCRSSTPVLDATWIAAQGLVPAALIHLSLAFPRDRQLLQRSPQLLPLLYGLTGCVVLFEYGMVRRMSSLWELPDRTLGSVGFAATIGLLISSYLTVKEADSPRERALARSFLYVAAGMLALSSLAALGVGTSLPSVPRRTIALAMTVFIAMLAYAAARFALFDVPLAVRWLTSYVVYTSAASAVYYAIVIVAGPSIGWTPPVRDPIVVFGSMLTWLVLLGWLQRLAWGAAEALVTPWTPRLQSASARHGQRIARVESADDAARSLAVALDEAFRPRGVAVFLSLRGPTFRLAHAIGSIAVEPKATEAAERIFEIDRAEATDAERPPSDVFYLDEWRESIASEARYLRECGLDLIAALRSGADVIGIVFLDVERRLELFSSDHRSFLEQACTNTGLAIGLADAEQKLQISDRMAAIGHAAAGLTHDLGRPIGEIYVEAGSLAERDGAPPDVRQGLASIRTAANEVLERLDGFVREGRLGSTSEDPIAKLSVLLEAACDRIAKLNEGRRPIVRQTTRLPLVSDPRNLQRVLENLLENATHFSPLHAQVEIYASADDEKTTIRVIDRGPGMTEEEIGRALGPFYSGRGGTGIGLAVCDDIVRGLGGTLTIRSRPGEGTTVEVILPYTETSGLKLDA